MDSIAVTYALMGPVMAVYRPIAALVTAIVTGLLAARADDDAGQESQPVAADGGQPCAGEKRQDVCGDRCMPEAAPASPSNRLWCAVRFAGAELLDDIAPWVGVGIVTAGAMITFVPPDWLAQWGQGVTAMVVMALIGIPMYICAVASTPVASALLLAGVSPGTVLVFLLVGPATNVASFALVRRELGMRVTVAYFAGITGISIAMGLLLDLLLDASGWAVEPRLGMEHEVLPSWLMTGSALLLLVLAIRPLRKRLLPWLRG